VNQRRQRARAASHEALTADFSEPRSRSRCCLSAQRWPLITYGEEASPGSHFDSSNIQPAAVATGSIITSTNALAAADSGRPAHPAASLLRVAIELHQPIRLNLRRASEVKRYRPSETCAFRVTAARRPAARPVGRAHAAPQRHIHLNPTNDLRQSGTTARAHISSITLLGLLRMVCACPLVHPLCGCTRAFLASGVLPLRRSPRAAAATTSSAARNVHSSRDSSNSPR